MVRPVHPLVDFQCLVIVLQSLRVVFEPVLAGSDIADVVSSLLFQSALQLLFGEVGVPQELSFAEVGFGTGIFLPPQLDLAKGLHVGGQGNVVVIEFLVDGNGLLDETFGPGDGLFLSFGVGGLHHGVPAEFVEELGLELESKFFVNFDFVFGHGHALVENSV